MNKKILSKFCMKKRDATLSGLCFTKPWSMGDYSYATNGVILIRIPKLKSIPERNENSPVQQAAEEMFVKTPIPVLKFPVPELYNNPVVVWKINEVFFRGDMLWKLKSFCRNCYILPLKEKSGGGFSFKRTWIEFDGGDGFIMPVVM